MHEGVYEIEMNSVYALGSHPPNISEVDVHNSKCEKIPQTSNISSVWHFGQETLNVLADGTHRVTMYFVKPVTPHSVIAPPMN